MDLYKELCAIAGKDAVSADERMDRHTTFRIGGTADWFVTPSRTEEVREIIQLCRKESVPYYIMGNGSNLLVGDRGYRGVIIQVFKKMSGIRTEGEKIYAQAGALLSKAAAAACEAELTGMEFASGIPGTLGGAIRMNAGAYGGEMAQVLESATVLTPEGEILTIPADQMGMGYRTSIVSRMDYVVLEAVLALKKGDKAEIRARMDDLKQKHVEYVHKKCISPCSFGSFALPACRSPKA